jgi:hypothetical protein
MSKECDEMLKRSGNYWPYQLSWVYRYTGKLPSLLTGKLGSMDRSLKGWKPLDGAMDTVGIKAEEYPFPADQERIDLLERFIKDCKAKDIRLSLIVSPMYVCSQKDVFKIPRELAVKHEIPFIDHYRDSSFVGHPELFYDRTHLNAIGAKKFTMAFAHKLKEIKQ